MDALPFKTQLNLFGLTKPAIRRIAAKAGVNRISRGVYDEIRYFIYTQLKNLTPEDVDECADNDIEFAKAAFVRVVRMLNLRLNKTEVLCVQRVMELKVMCVFANATSIAEAQQRKTVTVEIIKEALEDI